MAVPYYTLKKKAYYRDFCTCSDRLYDAIWHHYRRYIEGETENPTCDDDVVGWLDTIAAEKVNNPKSVFYIHG